MLCQRRGCPNLVKGQWAWASVFDERQAKKRKAYTKPHKEKWCLECYQHFEAHKYTYVITLPDAQRIVRARRVLRTDDEGRVIETEAVTAAQAAPVDNKIPAWAVKAEAKQAPTKTAKKASAKSEAPASVPS